MMTDVLPRSIVKTSGHLILLLLLVSLFFATPAFSITKSDGDKITIMLNEECVNLNKDKLAGLLASRLASDGETSLSPEMFKIMEGVIKRTDFDGIAEEKSVEIIGLVSEAYKRGAPLEYLDEIFDVAYVNTISVDQMYAAGNALREFHDSDVPQDVYEEFVYHSIENGWDPAILPVMTRGLIYGTDRGLDAGRVALIIMLDVKNGELKNKTPEQLVLNSIKLVREKEPAKWKPMSVVEKEMAAKHNKKEDLESTRRRLEQDMQQKERAMAKAETELKELREYPDAKLSPTERTKIDRDMEEMIKSFQTELAKFQQNHTNVVAELAKLGDEMKQENARKERDRQEKRERELSRNREQVEAYGKKGRLNRDKLNASVARYLGTPYRFGGDSERGIDCSAFTRRVYRDQGVELPRNSRAQARVSKSYGYNNVKTGDLIFFDTSITGTISHVGVYLGNNQFSHASSSRGVTKSSLREKYYAKRFVKAGRIFLE